MAETGHEAIFVAGGDFMTQENGRAAGEALAAVLAGGPGGAAGAAGQPALIVPDSA